MTVGYAFAPDPARAQWLNRRMHRELAASLRYLQAEVGELIGPVEALNPLLEAIEAGADMPATAFARYYELASQVLDADWDAARRSWLGLSQIVPWPGGRSVAALGDAELGAESERYQRMMNADPSIDIGFVAPRDEIQIAFRRRLAEGQALLEQALPALAGEIDAIIREIVIAGSDPSKTMQFDGGSHYQLWGALFLNGEFHPDALGVVEVLAHESAHSLLFGFCTDEPLVANADDELYASPLRADPRPMDGIYHATFVSARMHWAMSRMSTCELLGSADRRRAQEAAAADLRNFDAGYQVVAEHGRLTSVGAGLMAEAQAYISSVR